MNEISVSSIDGRVLFTRPKVLGLMKATVCAPPNTQIVFFFFQKHKPKNMAPKVLPFTNAPEAPFYVLALIGGSWETLLEINDLSHSRGPRNVVRPRACVPCTVPNTINTFGNDEVQSIIQMHIRAHNTQLLLLWYIDGVTWQQFTCSVRACMRPFTTNTVREASLLDF